MKFISRAESRKLLEASLRHQALKKYSVQLAGADAETTRKLMLQIDAEVKQELKKNSGLFREGDVIH